MIWCFQTSLMTLTECKYVLILSEVVHDFWTTNTSLPGEIPTLITQIYKNYPYFYTFKNEVLVNQIPVNSLIFYLLITSAWIRRHFQSSSSKSSEEWSRWHEKSGPTNQNKHSLDRFVHLDPNQSFANCQPGIQDLPSSDSGRPWYLSSSPLWSDPSEHCVLCSV